MMKDYMLGIVIVNYNGAKYQNDCIKCILNSNYKNYYIIVVDNASKDNSMELLCEFNDEKIITIKCDENYGVAKGNNIGIKKSIELKTDYTILLNNDTLFDSDLIGKLVDCTDKADVIVPKMYYPNSKTIWYDGGYFSKLRCSSKHIDMGKEDSLNKKSDYYDYAPTTCMLIKNDVFDKVGLMDEDYFLYFDDTDFCFRLKKQGYKLYLNEDAILTHLISQSSGGENSKTTIYYMIRNKFFFVRKYKKDFPFISRLIFNCYKRAQIFLKSNKYAKKAFLDFKKGKMGRSEDL